MSDASLIVNEEFVSLQGESTQAGRVCYFIRLAGCNLKCSYCDTTYAASPAAGKKTTVTELAKRVLESRVKLVEITGGEPLMQEATPHLAAVLMALGLEVMVETNGACDISVLPDGVRRIIDVKLPSSGMAEMMLPDNCRSLAKRDEVKFVVGSRSDFDYALDFSARYGLPGRCELLFSPVWGKVEFAELADWMLKANAPGRMQLQLHKLIWGDKRGV